jgi:hypothetical protein
MNTLQGGNMQSELAFIVFQLLKLTLRDTYIITIFLSPLTTVSDAVTNFFELVAILNVALSLVMTLALVGVVAAAVSKAKWVQDMFGNTLQIVVPWIDVCALLFITIHMQLLCKNAR